MVENTSFLKYSEQYKVSKEHHCTLDYITLYVVVMHVHIHIELSRAEQSGVERKLRFMLYDKRMYHVGEQHVTLLYH